MQKLKEQILLCATWAEILIQGRNPPWASFSRLNTLSSLSHSSGMSKAFYCLPGPLVDSVQHIHISFEHFSYVGVGEKVGITCLDLLVMLCHLQLQRPLVSFAIRARYWLMDSPGHSLPPQSVLVPGWFLPRSRTWYFLLWSCITFLLSHFRALSHSHWVTVPPASLPAASLALCHLQTSQSSEKLAPMFFIAMPGRN